MNDKQPFKFIRKWTEDERQPDGQIIKRLHCEYEASFWEGPVYAGQKGRYVRTRCTDKVHDGRFMNTSPGVSYHSQLRKSCGLSA